MQDPLVSSHKKQHGRQWMSALGDVFDSPGLSGLLREARFSTEQSSSTSSLSEFFDTELSRGIDQILTRATSTFFWLRDHEH